MKKCALTFIILTSFQAHASSVDCYKMAIGLKSANQDDKSKQAFAYNLCKGSEDHYPVTCYEEFLSLPDYIIPTQAEKHFTAFTICRGAIKSKMTPMNCFMEAIKLPNDLTLIYKNPIEFSINFCKAKH
ncbi:MAG: hypothetical protein ACOYL6_16230 [Bacteriovoracaceae bacterium]